MQFFYIDYINMDRKERNIGFLKLEKDAVTIGLRGIPVQCGNTCKVYAVNQREEEYLMGEVRLRNGYGMDKLEWGTQISFEDCIRINIPLCRNTYGQCVIREKNDMSLNTQNTFEVQEAEGLDNNLNSVCDQKKSERVEVREDTDKAVDNIATGKSLLDEVGKLSRHKWIQLMESYPNVHIFPEAQTILIKPRDMVVLTQKYQPLSTNSFLLHSYYNYRQLLLFRYPYGTEGGEDREINIRAAQLEDTEESEYYIGVAGIYNEREQRLAELFGFEGFENGESRLNEESKRPIYTGCFGYYMKRVEI